MFIDFREKGKERERNIDVREKQWLIASHTCPNQASNWKSRHVP